MPFPEIQQCQQVDEVYKIPSLGFPQLGMVQHLRVQKGRAGEKAGQLPKGKERAHRRSDIKKGTTRGGHPIS